MNKHIRSFTLYALPFTLALALQLCAFGAEKISYSGKLAKPDGSEFNTALPMTMTFRLYTKALGGYMMWGRTMPVRILADGSFYVELSDDVGSTVPEAMTEKLAEALVFGNEYWIGLSPGEFSEMLPRQKLSSMPRALTAETAQSTKVFKAPSLNVDTLNAKGAILNSLTVGDSFRQTAGATSLIIQSDQTLNASGTLKLTEMMHGVNIKERTGALPGTAPTDMIVMSQNADGVKGSGWSSIVVPKGATLRNPSNNKVVITFGKEF